MYFHIYIIIGILLIILSVILYNTYSKKKYLKSLNETFGDSPKDFLDDFDMSFLKHYYKLRKDNEPFNESIDELTWNDLDMDIVFKRLNYTKTTLGESYLYYKLREINYNKSDWEIIEKLSNVFTNNEKLRNEITLLLQSIGKLNDFNLTNFIYNPTFVKIKGYLKYPILTLALVFSAALSFIYPKIGLPLSFIFLCTNILIYQSAKVFLDDKFKPMTYLLSNINLCRKLTKIKSEDFSFFRDIIKTNLSPIKDLNKVRFYSSSFEKKTPSFTDIDIINDYIKMIFMVDIISYENSAKFLEKNKDNLFQVYDLVAKLDFALNLAYYRKSLSQYVLPEFTPRDDIELENLYHPLIKNPVKNSIIINDNLLFTGSNASGKSTFIKAIALNCILAQSLNTALCSKYKCRFSKIITSMAIKDNILSGDSYFMAEIKSLKRLLDSLNGNLPVLAFIDEILKGTNTLERISASASILNYGKTTNAKLLVATHDMELTKILSGYTNYHFSEKVTEDGVTFDYKLKKGPSKTRNALRLLKTLNFHDDIVSRANSIYQDFLTTEKWTKL